MTHTAQRRTAVITGASKGLGYALGLFLSRQGYRLIVTARDETLLKRAAQDFTAAGGEVKAVAGDIAGAAHRQQVAQAAQDWGGVDVLVNNASTLGPLPMPTLLNYEPQKLSDVFEVNSVGPLALVQALYPLLRSSRGLVVNVTSDAAVGGYEGWGGYGASKAALELISLTLANELRPDGIGVVIVDPGDMRTDMHQDSVPGQDISGLPLPEVTLPFWGWLLGQQPLAVSGQRYQAQADVWEKKST